MNFTLLNYFCVVAETRHMTKASKMLNISQPSLTSGIKRLENEVGVELFDRSSRNMELNEYGKIFLEHAQNIEREYTTAMRKINELKKLVENRFTLCIPSSPVKHDLAEGLLSQGFGLWFSNLPENWQQELLDGKLDLVATLEAYSNPKIESMVLCHNEIVIVASKNHPLAIGKPVTIEDVNQYSFSTTSTQHSPLACAKNKIASLGLIPNISFYTNGVQNVIESIRSSDRLAFMVKQHLPKGHDLAILDVENFDVYLPLYLYWRADKPKASIDRLIDYIQEYYKTISQPISDFL